MKIKFRKDTNIRSDHRSLKTPPLGRVYENATLEVEDGMFEGAEIEGDNRWWRDRNGWYYWAGGTEVVEATTFTPDPQPKTAAPPPPPEPPAKPPVAALRLVTLPVPEDPPAAMPGVVPDGEWRPIETPPEPPAIAAKRSLGPPPPEETPVAPPEEADVPPELLTPMVKRLNWGLESARIPAAWWRDRKLTGRGVTMAMIGTGVDAEHPDLSAALLDSFLNSATDTHGLGTQAAVVALGRGRVAYGVAPESRLLSAKIGNSPNDLNPEKLIDALHWAIDKKADVVALLADFPELSEPQRQSLEKAVARALDAGIVLIAPVGNSTDRKPGVRYPAAMEGVLSVGAFHEFNKRSEFSATSYRLDLLAPGEGLQTSNLNREFVANIKDTAIAVAFAAGLVALLRQWERQKNMAFSPSDVIAMLRETAWYEGLNKGKDTEYGAGLLNPAAILEKLT